MKKLILFLPLLLGLALWSRAGDTKFGERVTVTQTVTGDLYIGAGNIEVSAPVRGDLIAAGGELSIADSITADLMLAGGNITVTGYVGDDARLAGGKLVIRGRIVGDLIVAGGEVLIAPETVIGGDLFVAGGQVTLEGTVNGQAKVAGGLLIMRGTIEGTAELTGGELELAGTFRQPTQLAGSEIRLQDGAVFYGDVRYYAAETPVDFTPHLRDGATATVDESLANLVDTGDWRQALRAGVIGWVVYRLLVAALIIWLLVWLLPRFWERVGQAVESETTRALGYGVLYFLVVPLVVLLAFVILIGIPLGVLLLGLFLFTVGIAHMIVAIAATFWLEMRRRITWSTTQLVLIAVGIFALLKLLTWIPFIGALVSILSVVLAFGAVVLTVRELIRERRAEAPALSGS
jgi:cytoskeletal protein CcmA (bactofilin family)